MRALVQRSEAASVTVEGRTVGAIDRGLVILVGVRDGDDGQAADKLAGKCARLRVFGDEHGKMDRSLIDLGASALCVSQFTLYGDTRKGLRPSFAAAAEPELAESLFDRFCGALEAEGVAVERGEFGATMQVQLTNDGPVTLLLET